MSNTYFIQSFIIDEYGKKIIKKRYSATSFKQAKEKCNTLKAEHNHSFNTSIEIIETIKHFDDTETNVYITYAPISTPTLTVEEYTRTISHTTKGRLI